MIVDIASYADDTKMYVQQLKKTKSLLLIH